MNSYKLLFYSSLFITIISVAVLLMTIFEQSPVYYLNEPFPVDNKEVFEVGSTFRLVVERCTTRPSKYTVTRTFVNTDPNAAVSQVTIPSSIVSSPIVGCQTLLGLPITIPNTLPTGSWYIDHGISVEGRFRPFLFNINSQPFDVVNPDPQPLPVVEGLPYVRPEDRPKPTPQAPVTGRTPVENNTEEEEENNNDEEENNEDENNNEEEEEEEPETRPREQKPIIPTVVSDVVNLIGL